MNLKLKNVRVFPQISAGLYDRVSVTLKVSEDIGERVLVGVDPGTRAMGLAIAHNQSAELFKLSFASKMTPDERCLCVFVAVRDLVDSAMSGRNDSSCVEYAAFTRNYRQVELAEARTAAILALQSRAFFVVTPAINTIRATVFGNGRTKAEEFWPELPEGAATALSCALYLHLKGDKS